MIDRAAALPAQDAEAVRVIDDQEATGVLADLREFGQPADVAFHRVNALDNQHLGRRGRHVLDHLAQVLGIVVTETLNGRHRKPNAIPEAGMDVFVCQDEVALLGKSGDGGEAGNIAGDTDVAGLPAEKGGEFFLERGVIGARTIGNARTRRAGTPGLGAGAARLDDLGVEGQAEVIVAGEHDHIPPLQPDVRALLRLHGVVVGLVFQPHLRRVIILRAIDDGFFGLGEKGQSHGNGWGE